MNKLFICVYIIVSVLFLSCGVTKSYHQPPDIAVKELYRDQTSADTSTIASIHWEEFFGDSVLQNLISEGILQNLNLKIATARIREAEAYLQQSRLAVMPNLYANVFTQNGKTSNKASSSGTASDQLYQLTLNASWEADVWGKLKSSQRAALASLMQSKAYQQTVQTGVVASIANYYFNLLALDKQLNITRQSVTNWVATVHTMEALKEADIVTGAAVVQTEASRYAAEVTIPDLQQAIRVNENALSILLGRVPGPIRRNLLFNPPPVTYTQTGVPAQLLSNRPDVIQAEYNLRYSFELTNVARSYFYPSLTITAGTGWSGSSLSNLFNPSSIVGNVAAGLLQPLFNNGINQTRLKIALTQQQVAFYNFQSSLLTAGQEVSNSLFSFQTALEKTSTRNNELVSLRKAVNYTQQLVRNSSANYTEVLTAEQNLLAAELNQVNDQLQQWQSVVNLYRALGGGWR